MTRDDNHDGDHPKTSNTTPLVPLPTPQISYSVSSIKLPILKKGEYDIWAMKIEHYLSYTDYPIWQVIQNGNGPQSVTTDTNGLIKVLPPKTAEEVVARERERKARTTLLMALPDDHLAKFHKMADAKEMWEATKSRFSGNGESKKMQIYLLKQQFEGFSVSTSEGLHKGYDRFQTLLSQLEIHGAGVSHEDANQKFLRVFEHDVKVFLLLLSKSQKEGSSSYTDEVIHSLFANQSSAPQLDYDDLKQFNDDDMEEMDLKWQVVMISMRIKQFHKRTGRKLQFNTKDPVGFDKTKVECFNCHRIWHFARDCRAKGNQDSRRRDDGYNENKARDNGRRPAYQDDLKALVTINGEDIDWSGHIEEDAQNYAMMAYSSSNSGSDNEAEGDRVERAITTDASLETAHDSDNITKTQTTAMPNVDIPQGIDTGGRPRRQETMRGTFAQTRSERVLEQPNEPPLPEEETEEEAGSQGDSDQEVEESKLYMRIILEEDMAIEAIPLAVKPPVIIEYKIVKEGKISTYHITRADRSTRRYTSMINLLKNIDRKDLETL
nr:ribonuclease H-like domain-containing protein [Tanacetum cinerariifolium]